MKRPLLIVLAFTLSACSTSRSIGHFEGTYALKPYLPPGSTIPAKHEFVFEPDPHAPLRFIRSNNEVITPHAMWTDGGSVPLPISLIPSFGQWHYPRAYILHDWLMTEHRIKQPGRESRVPPRVQEVFDEAMLTEAREQSFHGERLSRSLISFFANHGTGPRKHWNGRQPDPLMKWQPR